MRHYNGHTNSKTNCERRITEIGNRIAKAADRPDMQYTFRVINNPIINAFSASGGYVYINTGLLDILESEDELAAVLAHEIGHTSKNHQIKFLNSKHRSEVAGLVAGILLSSALAAGAAYGASSTPYGEMFVGPAVDLGFQVGGAVGSVLTVSLIKGYGKRRELEADALAIKYTKEVGYDPNALISVFKKLLTIKNRLGINDNNYVSGLINAEPGLDKRIMEAELILNPDKNRETAGESREEE